MNLTLRMRNTQALVVNLYAADARLQAAARRRVRATGKFAKELTQFLCPVRTAFMRDHVRDEYSADGLAWQVGWWEDDFTGVGLPFYPPFVEGGTIRAPAQPSLGPAYLEAREIFSAELRRDLQAAIRRQGRT